MSAIYDILSRKDIPGYIHPFMHLDIRDTRDEVEKRILEIKSVGIRSLNSCWGDSKSSLSGITKFDQPDYWERINWVAEICRENRMTFMLQDAAPFPTGAADGMLREEQYKRLRKKYLAERHLDVKWPLTDCVFDVERLMGALRCGDLDHLERYLRYERDDKLLAVVAMRRAEENERIFDADSAVDLTYGVQNGLLRFNVPEGVWRIFVIYETYDGSGRQHYINLSDKASVAKQIQAVYEPHYAHLKEYAGKEWLGFFYDETEIGNRSGYFFNAKLGAHDDLAGDTMHLPWCDDMLAACRDIWHGDMNALLPLLWYEDGARFHAVRCNYMDALSRLVQQAYNGQVHPWCKQRGLLYTGHVLEDENSHCRLSSGPVHFFRMQKHQDMSGVDAIGGQIYPERDHVFTSYGCADSDGRFYHYGLAKLASSAARIDPNKNNKSVCEYAAVYGDCAGPFIRKFIIDHLFVNGVNNLIPASGIMPNFDNKYQIEFNAYANRMCHLLNSLTPVIRVCVLYHAQAEWYGGEYMYFQVPCEALAKAQISYDVIPSDVFEDKVYYRTIIDERLMVNRNTYDALIIPGADAIPASVLSAINEGDFPVFYVDKAPMHVAETGEKAHISRGETVTLNNLTAALDSVIKCDIIVNESHPNLRYARFLSDGGDWHMLHNEGGRTRANVCFPNAGRLYKVRMDALSAERVSTNENGWFISEFAENEMSLYTNLDLSKYASPNVSIANREPIDAVWTVSFSDKKYETRSLDDINGANMYPEYAGNIAYEAKVVFANTPRFLAFDYVGEACELYINGKSAGVAYCPPFRFDISKLAKIDENAIYVDVQTGYNGRGAETKQPLMSRAASDLYTPRRQGGIVGDVAIEYEERQL